MTVATSIAFENLTKSFVTLRGRIDVLRGIGLLVHPGEFFVLLGPSGCGKSTLLNLIAGLEKPSGGTIRIGDTPVAAPRAGVFLSPFERDVAMVFQSYALYPHMSIFDNIAFPLTNLKPPPGREEIRRKVRDTAALLRIEDLLDRKAAELSGGQRQRVAIGRAIVREPRVFLMDEPLSNLDARLRMEMRAQLKDLQRNLGVTTIYVTHDQMEAMTLGDRVAVLHEGKVQQLGTPEEVYDSPANEFVARFMGSPPMNLIRGEVVQDGARRLLKGEGVEVDLGGDGAEAVDVPAGRRCTIGVRPEHIRLVPPGEGNLDVTVNVVENIGSEYLCYVFLDGGERIVARSPHRPAGDRTGLAFEASAVRLFNDS